MYSEILNKPNLVQFLYDFSVYVLLTNEANYKSCNFNQTLGCNKNIANNAGMVQK